MNEPEAKWNVAEWHWFRRLHVAVTKEQVEAAPDIAQRGEELSQADESAFYHQYVLNYTPPNT